MGILEKVAVKIENNKHNKQVYKFLSSVVAILGIFLVMGLLFPEAISAVLNILWILLLALVVIFFGVGALVIFGMREQANQVMDYLLEGSLTLIEFLDFLKEVYRNFIRVLKEFLLYAAPVFAYVLALILYVVLLYIYKTVGIKNDVTLLTVILTVSLTTLIGVLNRPKQVSEEDEELEVTWKQQMIENFRKGFIDGFEVILFVFFLTMDSTELFFLPNELNVEIRAKIREYDLMVRSFVYDPYLRTTLNIIIAGITLEVFRNVLRLAVVAREYYRERIRELTVPERVVNLVKYSVRKSFQDLKDDLIKFVTYTTALFVVFIFLPRLKLLTILLASGTSLLLDVFIRSRLRQKRSDDLVSRVLAYVFKL